MKYRVIQPFIAFGMAKEIGEIVDLTEAQAAALRAGLNIAPYETKVMPPPENKTSKKQSGSSRPAPRSRKRTAQRSRKRATK